MALLRPAGPGRIMVTRAAVPMLSSPDNVAAPPPPANVSVEPAGPAGWGEVFFDSFRGTALNRQKWQILFGGGPAANGAYTWDHGGIIVNNGLVIRTWHDGSIWRGGGIGQGNTVTGFAGYGDFQFSIKARFPRGQGIGAYFAAWPSDNSWPPEFDLIETPGKNKDVLMTTWHWVGNNTGVSLLKPLDLTQDHVYTARRTNGRWNLWVDGVEVSVPADWAQHPDTKNMNVQLASFVALSSDNWYGGGPDGTTPNPYDVNVSWVRVLAPGGGALSPLPDADIPDPGLPTTARGRPTISGNTILTDQGTRLRGATMALDGPGTEATIFAKDLSKWKMLRDLKLNAIRVDIPLSLESLTLDQQKADIETVVDNAAAAGMYVILMNSTQTGTYSRSELMEFWGWAAPRFKDHTHVIYEMTNEPKYDAAGYTDQMLQDFADVYNVMHQAAPNTLIGVLDFAAVGNGSQAVERATALGSRGVTYGPAWVAFHPYWETTKSAIETLKASFPVMSTEIVYGGSGFDDVPRLVWCEELGISWFSLCGRWGLMTDGDDPYGASVLTLRERVLPGIRAAGHDWAADTIAGGSGGGPTVPGEPSGTVTAAQAAQNFVGPLTIGMNIERGNAWALSYQGQSLRTSTAYWNYLKSCGYTHVRVFFPYRPNFDMLGAGLTGGNTPNNGWIDTLLDSCSSAIAAGLKVFADWTDVINDGELGAHWTAISSYLDRVGQRIAARSNLSTSMLCVGGYNELEVGDNASVNHYRLEAHRILRGRLPNHVLMTGSGYWNDPSRLTASDWQMVADRKVVAQWHTYPTDLSAGSAQGIRNDMVAFSQRNGGIPTVSGEAGFNNGWRAGDQTYAQVWHTNMRLWAQYCGLDRPMFWSVTNGSLWRANRSSSDPTLIADIETTSRACDQIIRGLPGYNPLPYPGV